MFQHWKMPTNNTGWYSNKVIFGYPRKVTGTTKKKSPGEIANLRIYLILKLVIS